MQLARSTLGLLGFTLGYIFGLVPSKPRLICKLQLKKFLNRPEITPLVFAHVGQLILETLFRCPPDSSFKTPDLEETLKLLNKGKGLLVLTAHYGAWDLLGAYAARRGIPLYAIGRPARRFQWLLEWLRNKHGIKTIWRVGKGGAQEIERLLLSGNVVAAVIDQDTRVKSIPVKFFNQDASTPVTVARMALSLNIPIISAFIRRDKKNFIITTKELSGNTPEDILLEFNQQLEEQIRIAPEQWVWFHQRWRTNNDGTRLSYNDYINFMRS